jgi:hypothetical protein
VLGADAGVLPPPWPQFGAVVGAVVDADAVVVDLPPRQRQQLQVVLPGQEDVEKGLQTAWIGDIAAFEKFQQIRLSPNPWSQIDAMLPPPARVTSNT